MGRLRRPLRMPVLQQPRKDPPFPGSGDRAHLKALHRAGAVRNAAGGGHRLRKRPGTGRPARTRLRRRRKRQPPRSLKVAEGRDAARLARIAKRVEKAETRADLPGERHPARKGPGRRQGVKGRLAAVGKENASDRVIRGHGATVAGLGWSV